MARRQLTICALLLAVALLAGSAYGKAKPAAKKSPPVKKSPPTNVVPSPKAASPSPKAAAPSPKAAAPSPKAAEPSPAKKSPPSPAAAAPPAPPAANPYAYSFTMTFDGFGTGKNGNLTLATTYPEQAVDFIRHHVVNDGRGDGSDPQIMMYRYSALQHFATRFGITIPKSYYEMPKGETPTTPFLLGPNNDSMVIPFMNDEYMNGKMQFFRNRGTLKYFDQPNSVKQAGYMLVVGESGLPAGGTYKQPLAPGMSSQFGGLTVQDVCPHITQAANFFCRGEKHSVGQLLIAYKEDMPSYPIADPLFSNYLSVGGSTPAQIIPIRYTTTQSNWGKGSCTGAHYGAPQAVDASRFGMLSTITCTFGAQANYAV